MKLLSNLFALGFPKEWQLFQYHVDYKPSIASIRMKVALLYSHKDVIGQSHAFDGAMLYLSRKLQDKVIVLITSFLSFSTCMYIHVYKCLVHYRKIDS